MQLHGCFYIAHSNKSNLSIQWWASFILKLLHFQTHYAWERNAGGRLGNRIRSLETDLLDVGWGESMDRMIPVWHMTCTPAGEGHPLAARGPAAEYGWEAECAHHPLPVLCQLVTPTHLAPPSPWPCDGLRWLLLLCGPQQDSWPQKEPAGQRERRAPHHQPGARPWLAGVFVVQWWQWESLQGERD